MNPNVLLLLSLLLPRQAGAAPQDAKAVAVFQAMQAKYASAQTLTFVTTSKRYSEKGGKKGLVETVRDQVEARRSGLFHEEKVSTKPAQAIQREVSVSDGKTLWIYDSKDKQYMKTPAEGLVGKVAASTGAPGSFFLRPDDLTGLTDPKSGIALRYLGKEKIAGVMCDKVEIHYPSPMAEIPASAQTYYIDGNHLMRRLTGQMKFKSEISITVIDVQSTTLDKKLPDSRFTFTPPPGATEKKLPTGTRRFLIPRRIISRLKMKDSLDRKITPGVAILAVCSVKYFAGLTRLFR